MMDNNLKGKVIGVAFDGTGFGSDRNIWGGEFLSVTFRGAKRLHHLTYAPMPGGDMVVKEPWRMALSYLYKVYGEGLFGLEIPFVRRLKKSSAKVLIQMIKKGINSPLSSSVGRLFDGVSSLITLRERADYEAQAAIELEGIADPGCMARYKAHSLEGIIRHIVRDLKGGEMKEVISAKFHNTIAFIIRDLVLKESRKEGTKRIVFSGGVFQNRYLVERLKRFLEGRDLRVYFNRNFSTTDSSLALGQIGIANN
jgi:hydrogenase maturation protein HypF